MASISRSSSAGEGQIGSMCRRRLRFARRGWRQPARKVHSRIGAATQASAIWARVWPARLCSLSSHFALAIFVRGNVFRRKKPFGLEAREPLGMPRRYLSVNNPCASGEKAMQPMPSCASVSSRPVFNPAVEHAAGRLVNEALRPERAENLRGLAGRLRLVIGNARVQRLPTAAR